MPIATKDSEKPVFELEGSDESTSTVEQDATPPFDAGETGPVDLNFTPHSQVDISEAGESYRVRDSETGATSEGDTRGKALASLAAKLISGDYSERDRPELFDIADTAGEDNAETKKRETERAADTDYDKSRDIEIGQDDS